MSRPNQFDMGQASAFCADTVRTGEDQLPAQGQVLTTERYLPGTETETAGKPALFIKFMIVGGEQLGHHTQQPPVGEDHGAVVQRAIHAQGRAHHGG